MAPSQPTGAGSGWLALDRLGVTALLLYLGVGGLFVFGFASALVPAVDRQAESPCRPMRPEPRAQEAPDVVLQDLEGAEVRLSDFRGKLVVINFWATWCPPCISEWPQIHQLGERLADRDDVVVLAVSVDEDRTLIPPFLARMAMGETKARVLWDPEQTIHTQFGTTQLPDTYFVDPEGRITHAFIDVRKWGSPTAVQCIESVLTR